MRLIYVSLQHNHIDMQHNYVDKQHTYVNVRDNYIIMRIQCKVCHHIKQTDRQTDTVRQQWLAS